MCFVKKNTQQCFIEEITGGSLSFIDDDQLATELANFLTEKGLLNISWPID